MNEPNYFQNPNSPFLLNVVQEGDGLELLRDLKDEVAQLVIFDPQYKNAKISAKHIRENYHSLPHINQNKTQLREFCQEILRILKPNGYLTFWICRDILLQSDYHNYLPTNLKTKELLVWVKGKYLALGSLTCPFRQMNEYCLLVQKKPYKDSIKNSRSVGNIFNEIVNFTNRHNTHQKPLKMTETIIQQLTNKGDLVVDPCAGSFVSLRACQKLERNFLGTDLTLRKLMKFNINKERSRKLLRKEGKEKNNEF